MKETLRKHVLLLSAMALISLPALAQRPPVRGFPTGEEVLNRKTVRRAQPDPDLNYQPNGFRPDRLSRVPPVGVHPRVIMSPEDIPTIRENIKNNPVSKKAWEDYKKFKEDYKKKDMLKGEALRSFNKTSLKLWKFIRVYLLN